MSTIAPVITKVPNGGGPKVIKVTWTPVTENDSCTPVELHGFPDKSIQFAGTFSGGTVVLKCSNDGTNYENVADPQGNDISKTAADLEQIQEIARYYKPSLSGGSGNSLTITIIAKASKS